MSGFDAGWLDLREPADARARSRDLVATLRDFLGSNRPAGAATLRIVDLGGGTGANLRWLAPLLGGRQHWQVIDHDPALLDALASRLAAWADAHTLSFATGQHGNHDRPTLEIHGDVLNVTVERKALDLGAELDSLELPDDGLITASALLDLVSRDWLELLCGRIAAARVPALFALSYDGRIDLDPPDARDGALRDLVNAHQTGIKGFGAALGPAASEYAARTLARHGYRIERAASDWRLDYTEAALCRALMSGWAGAAGDLDPSARAWLQDWCAERNAAIDATTLGIVVGHEDLLALPAS